MTDLEISKALALAIGWSEDQITVTPYKMDGEQRALIRVRHPSCGLAVFSYRDWNVIGPIAAKYNLFPYAHRGKNGLLDGKWVVWPNTIADTPQKAIALAVIQGAKK